MIPDLANGIAMVPCVRQGGQLRPSSRSSADCSQTTGVARPGVETIFTPRALRLPWHLLHMSRHRKSHKQIREIREFSAAPRSPRLRRAAHRPFDWPTSGRI